MRRGGHADSVFRLSRTGQGEAINRMEDMKTILLTVDCGRYYRCTSICEHNFCRKYSRNAKLEDWKSRPNIKVRSNVSFMDLLGRFTSTRFATPHIMPRTVQCSSIFDCPRHELTLANGHTTHVSRPHDSF